MSVKVGSFWKSKSTGEGHVVKEINNQSGIMGQEFAVVKTLSESGATYTHTVGSLEKYYEEVDDV